VPDDIWAAVDIGGTNTPVALATSDGTIVAEDCIPTLADEGPARVLDRIATALQALGRKPAGVGIGVPGLADLRRGRTLFLPNLTGNWRDVPVGPMLSERLGCPVYLLNDVRMATLGELTYGLGRDVADMLFLAVGTGIGGGVVIDGQLRLGALGAAGEIGHQTLMPDGPLCGCGNRGCLETIASGTAIAAEGVRLMRIGLAPSLHAITDGNADRVTTKEMAKSDDSAIRDCIRRAATWLAIGIANAVSILHPSLVVLGGGVPAIGAPYLDTVREVVRERVRMFPVDDLRIERSILGDKAGLYGGIALARQGHPQETTTHASGIR
jgi:glucokinase